MLAPKPPRMSLDDFLVWEAKQDEKWELVDGVPIQRRTRMMAGGTGAHARIASNIIRAVGNRLPAGPCVPYGSDLKVVSPTGASRYPDVTVDCGPYTRETRAAVDPRVVFEVLSPSNDWFTQVRLLEDYQALETVEHIVFVNQEAPLAQIWSRDGAVWRRTEAAGAESDLALPALQIALPMASIYEGVTFE